jgi:hypothetical protein
MRHRTAFSVAAVLSAAALAGYIQHRGVALAEPVLPAATAKACVVPQTPPALPDWKDVEQFCRDAERGQPWPGAIPPPPAIFEEKSEAYALSVQTFLRSLAYREQPYGWQKDAGWRLTGPYEGCPCPDGSSPCSGVNKGPHPAVRIYYSPEVVDWMCKYRKGPDQLPDAAELPDGAMIVKEMLDPDRVKLALVPGTDKLWIAPIPGKPADYYDQAFDSWTVMIKSAQASADGWYWAYFGRTGTGNPPILDKSAFTTTPYPGSDGKPVTTPPGPEWYPTFWRYSVADVQFPNYGFGNYCTYCHASAQGESTFASLGNVLGKEIRYAWRPTTLTKVDFDDHHRAAALAAEKAPRAPFPAPRDPGDPLPGFREAFPHLDPAFERVWEGRLPAQTYDHVVSRLKVPGVLPSHSQFVTSDQCQGCHEAGGSGQLDPPYMVAKKGARQIDLSPWAEWSASPMGLAGRDPIFHAQLELERNIARRQPSLATVRDCIDNTCLHCHGAAGARQYNRDTAGQGPAGDPCAAFLPAKPERAAADYDGALFTQGRLLDWRDSNPAHARYGNLARDGITCAICHKIADRDLDPKNLPKTFTGNFRVGPADKIFGPFPSAASLDKVLVKPMENALGLTPEFGPQTARSEMCGSCHTVFLPVFDDHGKLAATAYEQTTYLEWLQSAFSTEGGKGGGKSCQECHMPHTFGDRPIHTGIANVQDHRYPEADFVLPAAEVNVPERPYKRHQLYGLNAFLNAFFQQFPLLLGYRQQDYMNPFVDAPLLAGRESVLEVARRQTAEVRLDRLRWRGRELEAGVTVVNLAGHHLPSGVGFRRLFVEFLVLDGKGHPLWASGRTNEIGEILEGTGRRPLPSESWRPGADGLPLQPHHQRITGQGQVQIYEEVTQNESRQFTSSFVHRYWEIKDNRLRPQGFSSQRVPAGPLREEYAEATRPGHGPHRHWWPKPEKPEPYVNPESPALERYKDTEGDPDYDVHAHGAAGLPGADSLVYRIRLTPAERARARQVRVTLYSQSIPPHYLEERFRHAAQPGAERQAADRLHYMAGHLDTGARAEDGKPYLQGYKLRVGESAERRVPARW